MTSPTQLPIALLHPADKRIYKRAEIYDPTWTDPSYSNPSTQKIVPQVGSLVQDVDGTPLWVVEVDESFIPSYSSVKLSTENDNVISLLNYGNSQLRLFVDYRKAPYPATPDPKCIFIGKSPRFYTLTRHPGTSQESIISQYYDATGKLVSQMVPLNPTTPDNTSWYLPRCKLTETLAANEEVRVTIYNEDGYEVYSGIFFAKESTVLNADVVYSPSIVSMTVEGSQRLADGSFFLYEKQDFDSLGLTVTITYDDGSTFSPPIDGTKCVIYGKSDFISSFSGMTQYIEVKYFRSGQEAIDPTLADATGSMISVNVPVKVVPNDLGTTVKIMTMPVYSPSLARYVLNYYMYFGDGRPSINVTSAVTFPDGSPVTTPTYYGIAQTYTIRVNMADVDPAHYSLASTYTQTVVLQLNPPTSPVRWTIRDGSTSANVYGQNTNDTRRPSIRYDAALKQYFIPSFIFGNKRAFLTSFYAAATPPFDATLSLTPIEPTHFLLRDVTTGNMLVSAPIPVENFSATFSILNDTTGQYKNATVIVEFLVTLSLTSRKILFGVPVEITEGTFIALQ